MVAQTSKDCSLMFEFTEDGKFETVSVVDFDFKYPDLIASFYYVQDQQIVDAFQANLAEENA